MQGGTIYLAVTPSRVTGRRLAQNSAECYLSLVKAHLQAVSHGGLLPQQPVFLKRVTKGLRREAPPSTARRGRLPVGIAQLSRLPGPLPPGATKEARRVWANERAALLVAWQLLLRPGNIAYSGKRG